MALSIRHPRLPAVRKHVQVRHAELNNSGLKLRLTLFGVITFVLTLGVEFSFKRPNKAA